MANKPKDDSKRNAVRSISKAPPPPPRLPNSYIPPRDYSADYAHWNRFPITSVCEAIFLTIGIEPRASRYPKERKNKDRFFEIDDLAQAHISYGSLEIFPRGMGQVAVSQWLDWLHTVDIFAPKEWRPLIGQSNQSESNASGESTGDHRRREYINAAIEMLPQVPNGQKDVINFMRKKHEQDPGVYQHFFAKQIDDSSLLRSIRNAATGDGRSNPLIDPRYVTARAEFRRNSP